MIFRQGGDKNMKLSGIAFRNVLRNKRRSLLSGSAIAVAAASIVFLFALLEGMKIDLADNLQTFYTGTAKIMHADYEKNKKLNPIHLTVKNPDIIKDLIKKMDRKTEISERITFPARIYKGNDYYNAMGMAVRFPEEIYFQKIEEVLSEGRFPDKGKEVLLGAKLASKTGVGVGDKITVLTSTASRGSNEMTFKVTGLAVFPLHELTNSFFMIPLDTGQIFLKMHNEVKEILVKYKTASDADGKAFADRILHEAEKKNISNIESAYWKDSNDTYAMIEVADRIYMIFAFFFLLLGCSVVINTTMMVIYERTKEIGMMKALGMKDRDIVKLFFLESFFIGILASLAGVLIGAGISLILNHTGINFQEMMEDIDFEISTILYPVPTFKYGIIIFLYSSFIASISTFIPTLRANKIDTIDALKHD